MATTQKWMEDIAAGRYDGHFKTLYGEGKVESQRERYTRTLRSFEEYYGAGREVHLYSTPGRTEIGGNHTDHNHGVVLAAAVNLDIIAVVAQSGGDVVRVRSEGFSGEDAVSLAGLAPDSAEYGRSSALIRGVAAGIKERGGRVGGFDAYTTSDVLKGSGLSSSAAFEVCLGSIFNGEFNEDRFTPIHLSIVGQYAENVFFGKPSGLMDQLACAVGSVVTIDFRDPKDPVVDRIPFDLGGLGYGMVVTDTHADHADLTDDYAAIPAEMRSVAACFGKQVLRDVDEDDFLASIPGVREKTGDRAVLRAIHFFEDCKRVDRLAQCLKNQDMGGFLYNIIEGGRSSFEFNQNAYSLKNPRQQAVPLALAVSQMALEGSGAWRLQGGGFAGTIQAFVPTGAIPDYCARMNALFGEGASHVLTFREQGCIRIEA